MTLHGSLQGTDSKYGDLELLLVLVVRCPRGNGLTMIRLAPILRAAAIPDRVGPAMIKWGEVELPGFDAPLVAVSSKRRKALAANVRELIADAKKSRSTAEWPEPLAPDEARAVATGCALCRGFCCSKAGDAAYLNPVTIKRVRSNQAHLTEDELVSAYLDAVPERAFKASCIFHAVHGCNLPPSMRSNVCHAYLCTPLRKGVSAVVGK